MPDPEPTPIATAEAEVWAALQIDVDPIFNVPVDRDFIRSLIVAAEHRIERFCGTAPVDMEEVPPAIHAAILLDVGVYYFFRLNPVLPLAWDEMIAPYRKWGFGGASDEN